MLTKLNPLAFILSFSIGLYVSIYFSQEEKQIYRYPIPDEYRNPVLYQINGDDNHRCYKYKFKKVPCSQHKNIIKLRPERNV